jgi:hypothetical protein
MALARFSRAEFKSRRWDYQPGEHVATIQPSQGGKTHWNYELAAVTDFGKPPVAMVIKAVDPTPARWGERLGWKETPTWPPPARMPFTREPPGYNLWPKHDLSMNTDALERTQERQEREFRKLLLSARRGGQAVIAGELYGLLAELHLRALLIEAVTRGSSARSPIWYDTQKPSGTQGISMPGQFFNCPTHLFLGYDPVKANRDRFSEIGGVNAELIKEVVSGCRSFCPPDCGEHIRIMPTQTPAGIKPISELLYINKNGPRGGHMCIIEVT